MSTEIEYLSKKLDWIKSVWLKKNTMDEEDSIFAFIPKIDFIEEEYYFSYPIIKILDKEQNQYKIIDWVEQKAEGLLVKHKVKSSLNGLYQFNLDKDYFDFNFNIEIVKIFVETYKELLKLISKNVTDITVLNHLMQKYSEDFKDRLDDSLKNIYGIEVVNKKQDVIIPNKEENSENGDTIEKVNIDNSNSEDKNEAEYFEMKIENDVLIKKVECDFEWNLDTGLRFCSKDFIELCIKLLEIGNFSFSFTNEEKVEDRRLVITNGFKSFCDLKMTQELLENGIEDKSLISSNPTEFKTKLTNYKDYLCKKCKFQRCPKYYSAYILYLYSKGLLKEKLLDRDKYRNNEFKSDYFTFKWEPKDGLKKIPKIIYEKALMFVEKELIWVDADLDSNERVHIAMPMTCEEYAFDPNFEKIETYEKRNTGGWKFVSRRTDAILFSCGSWVCMKDYCLWDVAGYIFYLQKSGQEEKIVQDRQYFEEHKDEIEIENKKIHDEKTNEIIKKKSEDYEKYSEELKIYEDKILNFNQLLNTVRTEKGLHCTIEGKRGSGKFELAEKVCKLLNNLGKIDNNKPEYFSLFNLCRFETYRYLPDDGKELPGRLNYEANTMIQEKNILSKHLYVLTDLEGFIFEYKSVMKTFSNIYAINRALKRIIEIITSVFEENYIILVSDKKTVDELLSLDNKLKFVYQNNRYEIANLSLDELFDVYNKSLGKTLFLKLREDEKLKEEVKDKFKEYVTLNAEYFPFYNEELSKYLANYTTSKNDFILPENVYKKETVEESLNNIVGLESVKQNVKEFEKYALYTMKARNLGIKDNKSNLHMIFTGNPGTGKTTVARIMAKMLYDLGLIEENKLIEVERKDLVAAYIGQTAIKTSEVIEKAMGGVLFIDEAYTLAGNGVKDFGAEAVATLIKAMEDFKDKLVVIFAGYKDEMKTFLEINPGIASRIGYTFDFVDYNVDELQKIFDIKIKQMGYTVEEDVNKSLNQIFEYFCKRKNFGNGRFVDKVIQKIIMQHASNDTKNLTLITKEDIPTIEKLNNSNYSNKNIEEMLDGLVGLKTLKGRLKEFEQYVKFLKKAEEANLKSPNLSLHMIFTGNPGTGKTTVARIVAQMLFDMGIVHENKVIEVERKDLVAGYIGQTAPKTTEVIEKAMGGVLFIDEAYTLAENGANDFGAEAVATLIKAMEDHKDELVVIFAGYRKEMQDFLNINPGIQSRIGYTFDFEDYDENDLLKIAEYKFSNMGYILDKDIDKDFLHIFKYFCQKKNFGNGRFVDKLIQNIMMKHAINNSNNISLIVHEDIPSIEELNNANSSSKNADEMLENLIGLKSLKKKMNEFKDYVEFLKNAEKANLKIPSQNMHMIFTGNPGTGKTTVARIIAQMLFDCGIIHENKLIEVERKDLIAEYIGQTAPKTSKVIDLAMGGILFIDEAYSLASPYGKDFGSEAIVTLIKAMEDHKNELIVIFAGYEKEMYDFINMNPGIASRIGYTFNFEDYSDKELCEIYYKKILSLGMKYNDDIKPSIEQVMKYFCNVDNIGNGRFVDKVVQQTLLKMSSMKNIDITILPKEAIPTIQEISENIFGGNQMIDPSKITDKSLKNTAIHEIGHATIRYLLKLEKMEKITINPEGNGSLGYVRFEANDSYTSSKTYMLNRVCVLLGGMCNEEVYNGEHENGNSSDLEKASNCVRNMIIKFGMSEMGFYTFPGNTNIDMCIYQEANKILKDCYEKTMKLLSDNKDKTKKAIDYLLKNKEIDEEQFIKIFES